MTMPAIAPVLQKLWTVFQDEGVQPFHHRTKE
jgi:hypothetical protein